MGTSRRLPTVRIVSGIAIVLIMTAGPAIVLLKATSQPLLLTASAVVVGSSVILFDPIFQGMAIALMFGEVAATLLSRTMVPVLYFKLKAWEGKRNIRVSGSSR